MFGQCNSLDCLHISVWFQTPCSAWQYTEGVGDTEIRVDVMWKAEGVDTLIVELGETLESDDEMVSVDKEVNDWRTEWFSATLEEKSFAETVEGEGMIVEERSAVLLWDMVDEVGNWAVIIAAVFESKGVLLKSGIAGNVELIMDVEGEEKGHVATIGVSVFEQDTKE